MKCKSCGREDIKDLHCDCCGELDEAGYAIQTMAKADETITTSKDITGRIEKAVAKTKGFFIAAGFSLLIGIICMFYIVYESGYLIFENDDYDYEDSYYDDDEF